MALDPLATIADLTARGVTVESAETVAVTTYFDVASALVREAAGSTITQATSTITLEGDHDTRLRLPGQLVQSVSDVSIDGNPVTDWKLASGALWRELGWRAMNWTSYGWRSTDQPSEVSVTYTHGLPAVPADIVDLVCRLVGQALVALRGGDPFARVVDLERIGDYQAKYGNLETGMLALSDFQRNRLAARFGAGPSTVVKSR
jgi:hypothetical protein